MFPSLILPFMLFVLAIGHTAPSDLLLSSVNQYCQSQVCGTNRSFPTRVGKAGPKGEPGEVDFATINGTIALMFQKQTEKIKAAENATFERFEQRYQKAQQDIIELKEQLKEIRCFLGMKNGDIPDSALSAVSSWNEFHYTGRARLDAKREGKYVGAFCPRDEDNDRTWFQVDLGQIRSVAGIIIQGREDHEQWVKTFKVKYGESERNLRSIMANGTEKESKNCEGYKFAYSSMPENKIGFKDDCSVGCDR